MLVVGEKLVVKEKLVVLKFEQDVVVGFDGVQSVTRALCYRLFLYFLNVPSLVPFNKSDTSSIINLAKQLIQENNSAEQLIQQFSNISSETLTVKITLGIHQIILKLTFLPGVISAGVSVPVQIPSQSADLTSNLTTNYWPRIQ